jgi:glycerate-2-kinase
MGKIKNSEATATTPSRRAVLDIIEAGLEAIDTERIVTNAVRLDGDTLSVAGTDVPLRDIEHLYIVAIGKCSLGAAAVLESILGDRISGGIVLDVREGSLSRIRVLRGDHPFPTERNIAATKEIIELLASAKEHDLVLFVISGGGSTLLCQPEGITANDESKLLHDLFAAGATIEEINTIRKHLSSARGGFLAKHAYPARIVSLIFSDVPGDDLSYIASGPTVRDETTTEDAKAVLEQYCRDSLASMPGLKLLETPKEKRFFERVTNVLAVSNKTALEAMAAYSSKLDFQPVIKTAELRGEARGVGESIAAEINDAPPRTVFLYGGETTVTLTDAHGAGGRNLELALAASRTIAEGKTIATVASDGRDNSDAAGAIIDIATRKRADEMDISIDAFLERHDSYEFFEQVGGRLTTGNTGSNVSDLIVALNK